MTIALQNDATRDHVDACDEPSRRRVEAKRGRTGSKSNYARKRTHLTHSSSLTRIHTRTHACTQRQTLRCTQTRTQMRTNAHKYKHAYRLAPASKHAHIHAHLDTIRCAKGLKDCEQFFATDPPKGNWKIQKKEWASIQWQANAHVSDEAVIWRRGGGNEREKTK
eukprot:3685980-Pleurochrysis_carterae.AAC.1